MRSDPRAVFDASSLVSATLLPSSVPRKAFNIALSKGTILASGSTIAELDDVLRRPKFDHYLEEPARLEFLAAMVREAELVDVLITVTECRDPKDNKYLELAVSGGATHIVSSDADLLDLHPFQGIEILTPQGFLVAFAEV